MMQRYKLTGYDCGVSPNKDGGLASYYEAQAEIAQLQAELAAERELALECQIITEEMATKWAKEKSLSDVLYNRLNEWCELTEVSEWKDGQDIIAISAYRKARGL